MKPLSFCVALFGILALVMAVSQATHDGGFGRHRADVRFHDVPFDGISSFLKIFVGIFSIETIVFGLAGARRARRAVAASLRGLPARRIRCR